jgi:hypothetical protein
MVGPSRKKIDIFFLVYSCESDNGGHNGTSLCENGESNFFFGNLLSVCQWRAPPEKKSRYFFFVYSCESDNGGHNGASLCENDESRILFFEILLSV